MILIICFWTDKYKSGAARLVASLDKLGLAHDVRRIDELGGPKATEAQRWRAAVTHKPKFIREMMEAHPEADAVVWIDADAVVHRKPELFWKIKEDLAAFFYLWRGKNEEELCSGTFFVRNSEKMRAVMDKWMAAMLKSPAKDLKPEQQMLQRMLPALGVSVYKLPRSYCVMSREPGWDAHKMPVVQHFQWSREARHGGKPPGAANPVVKKAKPVKPMKPRKVATPPRKASQFDRAERKRRDELRIAKTPAVVTVRRKRVLARRREEGIDIHEEQLPYSIHKLPDRAYLRRQTQIRLSRAERSERREQRISLERGTAGGVRGNHPTRDQVKRASAAIANMLHASSLDGALGSQKTVIVMGNSSTLKSMNLAPLAGLPVVGCNRALRWTKFSPNYLVIADREAYCQERDEGRLATATENGIKLLLAESLFDPMVFLRGPYRNPYRRAQPVPEFPAYVYPIGPKVKVGNWDYDGVVAGKVKLPFSFDSFNTPLVTCQNVSGSMLQAAVILGATTIAFIGVELKWPRKGDSHCYGHGTAVGAYEPAGSIQKILASMKQAKAILEKRGVRVVNLSPAKNSPWVSVWGRHDYKEFVKGLK